MGDYDQARRLCRKRCDGPDPAVRWSNLSARALGLKDFDAALMNARKAIGMAPAQAEAGERRGRLLVRRSAQDGARQWRMQSNCARETQRRRSTMPHVA